MGELFFLKGLFEYKDQKQMSNAHHPDSKSNEPITDRLPSLPRKIRLACFAVGAVLFVTLWQQLASNHMSNAGIENTIENLAILGGIAIFFGLLTYTYDIFNNSKLSRLKAGSYLAHWTYQPEEWDTYIKYRQHRASNHSWTGFWIGLMLGGITAIVMPFIGIPFRYAVVALVCCTLLGALFGNVARITSSVYWMFNRTSPSPAIIGLEGVYFMGVFRPYDILGYHLDHIELEKDEEQSNLVFTFLSTGENGSESPSFVPIPVPRDSVKEARNLLARIRRLC